MKTSAAVPCFFAGASSSLADQPAVFAPTGAFETESGGSAPRLVAGST